MLKIGYELVFIIDFIVFLGVEFDSNMSFKGYICNVVKGCFYKL